MNKDPKTPFASLKVRVRVKDEILRTLLAREKIQMNIPRHLFVFLWLGIGLRPILRRLFIRPCHLASRHLLIF